MTIAPGMWTKGFWRKDKDPNLYFLNPLTPMPWAYRKELGMSMSLYWRPIKPDNSKSLPDALKYILRNYFDCNPIDAVIIGDNLVFRAFLRGLREGSIDGAGELLTLLDSHEKIKLYEK